MSTSRQSPWLSRALGAALALLTALPVCAQGNRFQRAVELYEAAEYRHAMQLLEQIVAHSPSSEAYHWLGKSYGHVAEQASLLQALEYANKTREALEKAVELDHRNQAAIENLMEYYQQAPAIAGGSKQRARLLQERLTAIKRDTTGTTDFRPMLEGGS